MGRNYGIFIRRLQHGIQPGYPVHAPPPPASWWHDLWRDGVLSGNGFIGADVYGGVKDETVMLTHHKLWHNGKEAEPPDVSDAFHRLRELMDAEHFQEAGWTVVNALKEQNDQTQLQSPFRAIAYCFFMKK